MQTPNRFTVKFAQAVRILMSCIGEKGVWADPTRYKDQCWTRDFAIAIQPVLHLLGMSDVAKNHLTNLSALQRPNGQIPILFLDDEARWLAGKEQKSKEQDRESFMLRRYHEGELWNLTPGTRDSEILYIMAMCEYAQNCGDNTLVEENKQQILGALAHIESELTQGFLVFGADWRDTMEKELADKPLLTNNCLFYNSLWLMGKALEANALREFIWETHFAGDRVIDYPGNDRFDPLGGAFSVLFGVADSSHYPALLRGFQEVDTKHGVTIKCRHNPFATKEAEVIERTDGEVVWPFVVGFSALALNKMGESTLAKAQFEKMTCLDGFREWYDPATGKGYGAQEQLWSATLYIWTYLTLMNPSLDS